MTTREILVGIQEKGVDTFIKQNPSCRSEIAKAWNEIEVEIMFKTSNSKPTQREHQEEHLRRIILARKISGL